MAKPGPIEIQPPVLLTTLGGAVGVLLFTALLYLAPLTGSEVIDYPRLIGGIFAPQPGAAFWLGYAIFFLLGWLVWPPLMAMTWTKLPGDNLRFTGALQKGLLWGAALWVVAGLLLPLLGVLTRTEGVANPGLFGVSAGIGAAVFFLVGNLAYGVVAAVVGAMARGISAIETLGVEGYRMTGGLVEDPRTGVPAEST
jgi:hypothetical protein